MYREFIECLEEEVEAVVVSLPQNKVNCQDNHHDHNCQFFFQGEFKDLSRSFHVISDENERVFQIFNDHLRHLVDGLVPRNFYEFIVHDTFDTEHQVFHDISFLTIFGWESL